jgi:hypothetical protein
MPTPERPHFAFPFARAAGGGSVAVIEQDSQEHIMACAQVIANCPLGARDERPEFGWAWPDLVELPLDPTPLIQALNQFEPRAHATAGVDPNALANAALGVANVPVNIQIQSADSSGVSQGAD